MSRTLLLRRFVIYQPFLVFLFLVATAGASQYVNDKFHFTLEIPDRWKVAKETQGNTDLSVVIRDIYKKQTINIYAIKTKAKINLDKLAEMDKKLFGNLGVLESNKSFFINSLRTFSFLPHTRIEKIYKSGDQKTKLVFKSDVNYGYVIICRGTADSFSEFDKMITSLKSTVPLGERGKGLVAELGDWVVGVVAAVIIGGVLYMLGKLGVLIRKGVETRKILENIREEISLRGKEVNEKLYQEYKRKTVLWISIPLMLCFILFTVLLLILPMTLFLISLVGLIPVILGYFGILFGPSLKKIADSFDL